LVKGEEPDKFVEFLMNEKNIDKNLSFSLPSDIKKIIRNALLNESLSKCVYCETKINASNSVIEHFYPRKKFNSKLFEWDNLFISCENCNSYKGSKFPEDKEGKPLLLNPFIDEPFDHFSFTNDGLLESFTEKGQITIDVLGLNRFDLKYRRKTNLEKFEQLKINKSRDELEYEEFFGCYKLYRNHLSQLVRVFENLDLNRLKDNEQKENQLKVFRNKTIYIDSVQIKNFKAINDIRIEFKKFEIESRVPCLMLLGENGVGKTSIIQAISLALLSKESNDLDYILKKNKDVIKDPDRNNSAEIKIIYSEDEPSNLIIYDGSKDFQNTGQKIPILSYGAIRVERKIPVRDEHIKFLNNPNRISNAFSPRELMINANEWLIKLSKEEFSIVKEILEELLQLNETGESLERNRTSVFVIKNTNKVKIYLWSEGRRNVLVLVCDMLAHLSALWDKGNLHKDDIKEYSAVVMIDEIGAHLHPTWKMKIVSQLRKTFPKLQFICTTHDPLCLKGFKQGEIVVLRKDKDGKVFMVNQEDLPNPEAMRADQLLTSQYFGLNSTIDLDIEKKFAEYYDLLARGSNLTKEESEKLKELTDFVKDQKVLGDSTREQLYFQVIDSVIAKFRKEGSKEKISIKKEVIDRVNEELKKIGL
jgi:uncharacterized protein (TIGR02646 family)